MRLLRSVAVMGMFVTLLASAAPAAAVPIGTTAFQRTWERTDQPVASGQAVRTWMWGPEANSPVKQESYQESPGGQRQVQYFDKSRMEISHPDGDQNSIWYVTNGLLVVELVTGKMQTGDARFEQHQPAHVNVAGDADDPTGPTYATFSALLLAAPAADGAALIKRVNRAGQVTDDPALAGMGVTAAHRVTVPGIDHQVASPFWGFMNSSGLVYENGQTTTAQLFIDPFYATGLPITEAYWASVKVAGSYRDVLMQCFERRCLTYTPGNAPEWRVEMGNIGQHYYTWRYESTQPPTDYEFAFAFGEESPSPAPLNTPSGVTLDRDGNVWAADSRNARIVKLDPNGKVLLGFGTPGDSPGQLTFPVDLAFDSDGNVYVVDPMRVRVVEFTPTGDYVQEFGSEGTGDGQFRDPWCIGIQLEVVYICDQSNHRVEAFSLDGQYLGAATGTGEPSGAFATPSDLDFDADGNVYVIDYPTGRVLKFDSALTYLTTIGPDAGSGPPLAWSEVLAVGPDGSIYVGDWPVNETGQERIVMFDATGTYQRTIILPKGYGPGQFENIAGIAVNADGVLYTVDTSTDQLQKLQPDGTPIWATYAHRSTFTNPRSLAISPAGQLLVTDDYTYVSEGVTQYGSAVLQYALDGQPDPFAERIMYHQTENAIIVGVTVTSDGHIALTQLNTTTMDIYDADWDYADTLAPVLNPSLQPMGAATDAAGNYYIADLGNARVVKLAPDGAVLDAWVGTGEEDGQFLSPMDVAVFGQRVYVTDWQRGQVMVFTTDGTFLTAWGDEDGPGGLVSPRGIDVDRDGYVYVVDSDAVGRVNKYAPDGTWLATISGGGDEELHYPWGIAVAANGSVYVADSGNDRIVAYQPTN